MCPDCGKVQVETNISGIEGPNFGKHLYKCPIELFSAIGLFSKANSDHRAKRNVFFCTGPRQMWLVQVGGTLRRHPQEASSSCPASIEHASSKV